MAKKNTHTHTRYNLVSVEDFNLQKDTPAVRLDHREYHGRTQGEGGYRGFSPP